MTAHLNVGMRCIKYMLFVANFMFMLVGILLISFGSTIKGLYREFELFMEDHYFSPASLVIAVGIIILLIAAFGCAAAVKESTCMVNVYALMLLLALILEISASIAAYVMRADIEQLLKNKMQDAMKNYSQDDEVKEAVDFLQSTLACCGIDHREEWYNYNATYKYNDTAQVPFPRSCCQYVGTDIDCSYTYASGCLNRLAYIISESSIMLGTGALCIAFVQVLGIAFAVMLAKSIRHLKTQEAAVRWQTRQELYLQLARGGDTPKTTPVVYTPETTQES